MAAQNTIPYLHLSTPAPQSPIDVETSDCNTPPSLPMSPSQPKPALTSPTALNSTHVETSPCITPPPKSQPAPISPKTPNPTPSGQTNSLCSPQLNNPAYAENPAKLQLTGSGYPLKGTYENPIFGLCAKKSCELCTLHEKVKPLQYFCGCTKCPETHWHEKSSLFRVMK